MSVLLMCGLPASGKTSTAMRLHAALGGVLIRACDVYADLGIDLPAWVRRTLATYDTATGRLTAPARALFDAVAGVLKGAEAMR